MTVQEMTIPKRKRKKRTTASLTSLTKKLAAPIVRDHKVEKAFFPVKLVGFYTTQQAITRPPTSLCQREASNFQVRTDPFTQ